MRRLEARAARNGWDTPQELRVKVVDLLLAQILPKPGRPKKGAIPPSPETIVAVSRTLIAASLRQQMIDITRQQRGVEGGPRIAGDIIAEAAEIAERYEAEIAGLGDGDAPGDAPEPPGEML